MKLYVQSKVFFGIFSKSFHILQHFTDDSFADLPYIAKRMHRNPILCVELDSPHHEFTQSRSKDNLDYREEGGRMENR